ncbi:MAG: hydrolase, partial [Hyphomicrobiaceae bacterium]|nr:hydrolase [Hyphomicrobiaceae bacterium]
LHDASEYVVGDLISPFKNAIGLNYKAFELRLLAAIHERFGLPAELPQTIQSEIKTADRIAAFYEATQLAGFDEGEATIFFGQPEGLRSELMNALQNLMPVQAESAQQRFLARFRALMDDS